MSHQQRDIAISFAQWRERDRKHIQSVVQISTKPVSRDLGQEVLVGRRHDSDIDPYRLRTAKSLEFMLLKSAQEFWLQFNWQFANFVEKECAPIRHLEAADSRRNRSGARAAPSPHQF